MKKAQKESVEVNQQARELISAPKTSRINTNIRVANGNFELQVQKEACEIELQALKEAREFELHAQKEQCEFDLAVQKDQLKHTFTLAKAVSKDSDNTTSIFRT